MISFFTITNLSLSLGFIFLNILGTENETEGITKGKKSFTLVDKLILALGIFEMASLLIKTKSDGF